MVKPINNVLLKILLLRNWASIQIMTNSIVLFISIFFIESQSIPAAIIVTGLLIGLNVSALRKQIEQKAFRSYPHFMSKNYKEGLVVTGLVIYAAVRSLVFIQALSAIQFILTHETAVVLEMLSIHKVLIIVFVVLTAIFLVFSIMIHNENLSEYHVVDHIEYHVQKYQLDTNNTYFFTQASSVIGFIINDNIFDLHRGLSVGTKYYSFPLILEYLNLAGIGFTDIDDGHIKNIEMYGVL